MNIISLFLPYVDEVEHSPNLLIAFSPFSLPSSLAWLTKQGSRNPVDYDVVQEVNPTSRRSAPFLPQCTHNGLHPTANHRRPPRQTPRIQPRPVLRNALHNRHVRALRHLPATRLPQSPRPAGQVPRRQTRRELVHLGVPRGGHGVSR
jgi:hypothetical protein